MKAKRTSFSSLPQLKLRWVKKRFISSTMFAMAAFSHRPLDLPSQQRSQRDKPLFHPSLRLGWEKKKIYFLRPVKILT